MREVISLLKSYVTATVAVGDRPSAASDGVDITTWRLDSSNAPRLAQVFIDGSGAASITSPSDGSIGVELWGYTMGQWWLIAVLNSGNDIPIAGDTQGFAQSVNEIGDFDRLAVAGTVSAGSATAKFAPLERNMY